LGRGSFAGSPHREQDADMRIDLIVPFSQKDEAKKLGAKWDGIKSCWYVVNVENLEPFLKWMCREHVTPHKEVNARNRKTR